MTLTEVRNLTVTFGRERHVAVRGLSLSVDEGECVALVGESGSGKSVTARALVGLVGRGSRVTADRLTVCGVDLTGFDARRWRTVRGSHVALVLQDAMVSLDPLRTVGTEIGETLRLHDGHGRRGRASRVTGLLTDVGVPEPDLRRRQYPHQLSGGLRQRALIASALAGGPQLLIADEPTTALDVVVQRQILQLLGGLKADGRGLLLISHDLAVVAELADRVIVLHDGVAVDSGPTRQLLAAPTHPRTRMLIDAVATRLARPSDHGTDVVLRGEHLVRTYGRVRALDDVSFVLHAGEVLGVVGESGSGKSTLARIALGLLEPDSGQVLLDELPWTGLPERTRRPRRHAIGFVQQDPYAAFDPRYTVTRLIGEALPGLRGTRRRDRVRELLAQVGLSDAHLDRRPWQLSGGQRQRVAIARALATRPRVLVCDEPVSALDASVRAQVLDLLARLRAETGVALMFITHDLAVVTHVSDQVIVMRRGVVVERGPTRDVFDNPCHEYTKTLIAAVPTLPTPAGTGHGREVRHG